MQCSSIKDYTGNNCTEDCSVITFLFPFPQRRCKETVNVFIITDKKRSLPLIVQHKDGLINYTDKLRTSDKFMLTELKC